MRQDYEKFVRRGAEVVVVSPEEQKMMAWYWRKQELPFIGLPDPDHQVATRFGQEVSLLKLGRLPALLVVDKQGQISYKHYGHSMLDIPPNREILALLDHLNREGNG